MIPIQKVFVCLMMLGYLSAQDKPMDVLSPEFHKERRQALRNLMPPNSVAVFFSNPVRNRANDVDFHYHQDPNFYYLTGYKEPDAALLIFSNDVAVDDKEMLFVRPRNPQQELWNGKRLGVSGVKENLGFSNVFSNNLFSEKLPKLKQFYKVLFLELATDIRDNPNSESDLFSLQESFKSAAEIQENFDPWKVALYDEIASASVPSEALVTLRRQLRYRPSLRNDTLLLAFEKSFGSHQLELKQRIALQSQKINLDAVSLSAMMATLRETKTAEEVQMLKRAVAISAQGQIEVMKAMHPNLSETEIQGIHEFVYKKYGVSFEGYPSIVGSGQNGCVLHYITNDKPKVGSSLVLMDLGAEYQGYTADVTRTIPANGRFTKEQRLVYDWVLKAQNAGIEAAVVGVPFNTPNQTVFSVIEEGLMALGIIKSKKEARRYLPHGTTHYLGLDVHDMGTYGVFKPNTIITVEPGIYIPEGSPCDEKWWGIAIRIEDDILITENGPVNLSEAAPRDPDEIEAMMAEPSPLSDFKLPNLSAIVD